MTDPAGIIQGVPPRKTPGVRLRHQARCAARRAKTARCTCEPSYLAQVWIADPAGGGAGRNVTRTFASRDEALLWRSQVRVTGRRQSGIIARRPGDTPTIREAGAALLAGIESSAIRKRGGARYRPGVRRAYKRALDLYVYPRLGGWRLDQVRQPDLLDLVDELQEAGLSPSTIKNALDPVRVIYRRAVERGVVETNPTLRLALPAGETPRDRVADPYEAARLVAALPEAYDRALWAVAVYCGLRAGELRALQWAHVDLAGCRVRVEENLPVDAPRPDAAAETGDPKTKAGRREVPLAPPAIDALVEHRASSTSSGYVWPARDGGPFARTSIMKRATKAWEKAKLDPIGLHEARHSAASMWIASGWSVKVVSELIGHASIAITLDRYGHLFPAALDDAQAAFAAYLERADTSRRLDQLGDA
jgi:integrase